MRSLLLTLPKYPLLLKAIKVASCVLIAGALMLVVAKGAGLIVAHSWIDTTFWIASVALFFHGLEAIVAASLARRLGERGVGAAVYTFWTGVAGLSELMLKVERGVAGPG